MTASAPRKLLDICKVAISRSAPLKHTREALQLLALGPMFLLMLAALVASPFMAPPRNAWADLGD